MNFALDSIVMLVDRAMQGDDEIKIDGQTLALQKGEMKKPVPGELVAWMYQQGKKMVWTTDGNYVHRYAVENPPQWLLDLCGPDIADCTPIEIDTTRLEGWDTRGVLRGPSTKVIQVNADPREMRERVGGGERVAMMER